MIQKGLMEEVTVKPMPEGQGKPVPQSVGPRQRGWEGSKGKGPLQAQERRGRRKAGAVMGLACAGFGEEAKSWEGVILNLQGWDSARPGGRALGC